ncbi:LON peptidase substrate-binding domain-containing protein [Thalassotalea litorea]|uniref:LON peptidase substrate-binding domain-containing protein n=1 Tax=Thalassotalea litorea TaxID=2020715 RepID=UPI0037355E15
MNLVIFPLPIYLLPGGITRLRIFEQRYIKMVKQAVTGDGFVISQFAKEDENPCCRWGSHVTIVDFQNGDDGLLYIDVKCDAIVNIGETYRDEDNLLRAPITLSQHWPGQPVSTNSQLLADELRKFFDDNPHYASLYPQPEFDSPVWVCSRWLELIPINFDNKCCFIEPDSFSKAMNFLATVIIEHHEEKTDL